MTFTSLVRIIHIWDRQQCRRCNIEQGMVCTKGWCLLRAPNAPEVTLIIVINGRIRKISNKKKGKRDHYVCCWWDDYKWLSSWAKLITMRERDKRGGCGRENVGAVLNPPRHISVGMTSKLRSDKVWSLRRPFSAALTQVTLTHTCKSAHIHTPSSRVHISGRSAGLSLMYVSPLTLRLTLYKAISISLRTHTHTPVS